MSNPNYGSGVPPHVAAAQARQAAEHQFVATHPLPGQGPPEDPGPLWSRSKVVREGGRWKDGQGHWHDNNVPPELSALAYSTGPVQPLENGVAGADVVLGDIVVSQSQIGTPKGWCTAAGASWWVLDNSETTRTHPKWAMWWGLLFFPLFYHVKEETKGEVLIAVWGYGWVHATRVYAHNEDQLMETMRRVNTARSISGPY